MALYENGILISGANTLPQMTLAEYQALPVSERPTYWERTDLNYNNIPSSQVTYKNGSVEDALDDSMYRAGDTITLQAEPDAMYGYVRSSTSIRLFLPLRKPIDENATVSIIIPSSFGIATISGSVTLNNCTLDRILKNAFGLYLSIVFSSNSSLVSTTPVMCGINTTITFS